MKRREALGEQLDGGDRKKSRIRADLTPPIVRKWCCAIYTRKSSEQGLEQEFNSLHAQREACEAYIASQRSKGWLLVRDQYDDDGISGGFDPRHGNSPCPISRREARRA